MDGTEEEEDDSTFPVQQGRRGEGGGGRAEGRGSLKSRGLRKAKVRGRPKESMFEHKAHIGACAPLVVHVCNGVCMCVCVHVCVCMCVSGLV